MRIPKKGKKKTKKSLKILKKILKKKKRLKRLAKRKTRTAVNSKKARLQVRIHSGTEALLMITALSSMQE